MYAKVFSSLWQGSLGPDWPAWSVFVFLLAHADREGFADLHPSYISRVSGIPLVQIEAAIHTLSQPDPASRSAECEGRRIVSIDDERGWGWRIVNFSYYRSLQDSDALRDQARQRKARQRLANESRTVTDGHGPSRHTEADADADADAVKATPLVTAVTVGGAILAREGLRSTVDKSREICAKAEAIHAKVRKTAAKIGDGFEFEQQPLPPGVGAEEWEEFCAFRRTKPKRVPWTAQAARVSLRTLARLLAEGHDVALVIDQSITSGWPGLFALNSHHNGKGPANGKGKRSDEEWTKVLSERAQANGNQRVHS